MIRNKTQAKPKTGGTPLERRRSARRALTSGAFILLVIVCAVLLNIIADILDERYALTADLSEQGAFGVSDETKAFLSGLERDITITVLNTEQAFAAGDAYFLQTVSIMKEYDRLSDRVSLRFLDIIKDPAYASRYPQLSLAPNDIVVESGNNIKKLTVHDLFDIQTDYYTGEYVVAASTAERALSLAIAGVGSGETVRAAVLTGHGETDISAFTQLLSSGGFEVEEISLLTQDIPPDVQIAILAAPERDIEESNLKKLDAFLERNGSALLYFAGIDQPELPNIDAFLAEWGVRVAPGAVFEQDSRRTVNYNPYFAILDYTGESAVGMELAGRGLYTALPVSRPLELLSAPEGYYAEALLSFSQSGGILPPGAPDDWSPSPEDMREYIPGLVKAARSDFSSGEAVQSSVLVCASVAAVDEHILESSSIGNSAYFPALLLEAAGREQSLSIPPKSLGGSELGATSAQATALMLVFAVIIPLLVLAAGVTVWVRRRHR